MAIKISKEELATILKRLGNKTGIDEVNSEIEEIADEYNIDLSEEEDDDIVDEIDEEIYRAEPGNNDWDEDPDENW